MQRQSQKIHLTDEPLSLKPPCCHLADSNHIVDSNTLYQTLTATEAETEAGQGQQSPPVRSLATSLSTSKAIIIFSPLSLTRSLGTTRAMFFLHCHHWQKVWVLPSIFIIDIKPWALLSLSYNYFFFSNKKHLHLAYICINIFVPEYTFVSVYSYLKTVK